MQDTRYLIFHHTCGRAVLYFMRKGCIIIFATHDLGCLPLHEEKVSFFSALKYLSAHSRQTSPSYPVSQEHLPFPPLVPSPSHLPLPWQGLSAPPTHAKQMWFSSLTQMPRSLSQCKKEIHLQLQSGPNVPLGQHTSMVSMQNHLRRSGCFVFLQTVSKMLHSSILQTRPQEPVRYRLSIEELQAFKFRRLISRPNLLNHQVSKCSSCSSIIWLHSKLLLSHRLSRISTSRISLERKSTQHYLTGAQEMNDINKVLLWMLTF